MIDDRDIERAAEKLKRFGKDFEILKEGIFAYEGAKAKRLSEECPACAGTGKRADTAVADKADKAE